MSLAHGGPYNVDEFTGDAFDGGFTVVLDGSASSDIESTALKYFWDLGTDTFSGTEITEGKWIFDENGISQNNGLSISNVASPQWGQRSVFSKDIYDRVPGMAFEATVSCAGYAMVGFKNTHATNGHYNQYTYAIYFRNGRIRIYEDGSNRGDVGIDYALGQPYEVRIELKETQGARYAYREVGEPDWILLYDSDYSNATHFRRGVDAYDDFTFHAVREIARGARPAYRFYGIEADRPIGLTVLDQAGNASTVQTTVTTRGNDFPVVVGGRDINAGEAEAERNTWTFTFETFDDHGLYRVNWDFDYDGVTFEPSSETGETATHTFFGPGVSLVAIRAIDHALQTTFSTFIVTRTLGEPPVADAGESFAVEGVWPAVFDGSGSTDDVRVTRHVWDFGDGTFGTGPRPTHIYWDDGIYTVTLIVYDNTDQMSEPDTVVVTVGTGASPTANAGGPYVAGAGGPPAYFDGRGSQDASGVVKYLWDVDATVDSDGDGDFTNDADAFGPRPFHTYAIAGDYDLHLTVIDASDQTSTATTTVHVADNLPPDVICVPASATDPTERHQIIAGQPTRLKAIVRDAGALTAQWDFGDGSPLLPAEPGAVSNKYILQATHTYPADAVVGQTYTGTVTVWDGNHAVGSCSYRMEVATDSLDTWSNIAIDEGLWYLHRIQDRSDGHWTSYQSYYASPTASAVQAYLIRAHREEGDNQRDPYVENVNRGMAFLFTQLRTLPIDVRAYGNPDSNGNGVGIEVGAGRAPYEGGIVMDALATTRRPLGFATTGPDGVKGLYYHEIAIDMADAYAWGQFERAGTTQDRWGGGWRYRWHDPVNGNDARARPDNSACQWWAIGGQAVWQNFGIATQQWVIDRNLVWLDYSFDGDHFKYIPGREPKPATTASGLVQLAFDDIPTWDHRWRGAENHIANNWPSLHDNYYAMFALVKAFRLAKPNPVVRLSATGLDWYSDPEVGVRRLIIDDMTKSGSNWGSWRVQSGNGSHNLHSAWAIIMLSTTLFVEPPIADAGRDLVWGYDLPLRFDGALSRHLDSRHAIVLYEWDFDGDGTYDFATTDPRDPAAQFTYPDPNPNLPGDAPQTFHVTLRVTDNNHPPKTDTDTRVVLVAEPPHAPLSWGGGPYMATENIPFELDARDSLDVDAGDSIRLYEWDLTPTAGHFFTEPGDLDISTDSPFTRVTFAEPGEYTIALRVWDYGVFNPLACVVGVDCVSMHSDPNDFVTVFVEGNVAPVADAGDVYTGFEGAPVRLDGVASYDLNGDALTYGWDLDGDGRFNDADGAQVDHTFADQGEYDVALFVSDTRLDDEDTARVTIENVAPNVLLTPPALPVSVGFDDFTIAEIIDPGRHDLHLPGGGPGTAVDWGEGDGYGTDGFLLIEPEGDHPGEIRATHVYTQGGLYPVSVRICDELDCSEAIFPLTVSCGTDAPPATMTDGVCAGEVKICDGINGWVDPNYDAIPGYEQVEITCDGLDNDCNGATDEGVLNACGTCGLVPDEVCDGVDNDCDPATPDGSGEVGADNPYQRGVCIGSTQSCLAGVWQADYSGIASYELVEITCDGLDNDCNGETDEGLLNACGECGLVPDEVCDGVDNDCDGEIDEGCESLICERLAGSVNYVDHGFAPDCPSLEPGPGRLVVVDGECRPMADVRVNLRGADNRYIMYRHTGADGVVNFSDYAGAPVPDHFEVSYNGENIDTAAGTFDTGTGIQTQAYSLALIASDCAPIGDVTVNLYRADNSYVRDARTDAQGQAIFQILPGVAMKLEVDYNGGRWRSAANTADRDVIVGTERFELLLIDIESAPIPNARVNLRRADNAYVVSGHTNAKGVAGFEVLPEAPLRFEVDHWGAHVRTGLSIGHARETIQAKALSLRLTDGNDVPVLDARVNLRRADNSYISYALTDTDGVALFEVLPGVQAKLEVDYNGARYTTDVIQVEEDTRIDLYTYTLGTAITDSFGTPIPDVGINLRRADGRYIRSDHTGAAGAVSFQVLPGACMKLEVDYNGARYMTNPVCVEESIQMPIPLPMRVDVQMTRFGLMLLDRDDQPIENARVNLRRADGAYVTHERTGADGIAEFEVLPEAQMILEVDYDGVQYRTGVIDTQAQPITVVRTVAISLRLTDSGDLPIANARINLRRADKGYIRHASTDSAGVATFQVLPGAILRLEVDYNGGLHQTDAVVVNAPTQLTVATVPFVIGLTASGAPLDNHRVDLLRTIDSSYIRYARTDATGSVTFEILPGASHNARSSYDGDTWTSNVVIGPARIEHAF